MKRIFLSTTPFLLLLAAQAWSAELLAGRWQMLEQQVGKERAQPFPMTLRIEEIGGRLKFSYLSRKEESMAMTFEARTDGTVAVIKNASGASMGVVRLTKVSDHEFKLVMKRPSQTEEPGIITISKDGKFLKVDTQAQIPGEGQKRLIQLFGRE